MSMLKLLTAFSSERGYEGAAYASVRVSTDQQAGEHERSGVLASAKAQSLGLRRRCAGSRTCFAR
jgi:hypothetical protein